METSQHEVATRGRIDDEAEMVWDQVLSESIALDARECSESANGPVRVRVQQREDVAAKWLALLLRGPRNLDPLKETDSRGARIRNGGKLMAFGG